MARLLSKGRGSSAPPIRTYTLTMTEAGRGRMTHLHHFLRVFVEISHTCGSMFTTACLFRCVLWE